LNRPLQCAAVAFGDDDENRTVAALSLILTARAPWKRRANNGLVRTTRRACRCRDRHRGMVEEPHEADFRQALRIVPSSRARLSTACGKRGPAVGAECEL